MVFMDLIFVLLTQLINETIFSISFEADHGCRLLPELRPRRRRCVKLPPILQHLGENGSSEWKIRVLMNGEFTGIELDPMVILRNVRVVFRVDRNVLCIGGAGENCPTDYLLRTRYVGFMRSRFWKRRQVKTIYRSDSKLATKLRNLEGGCQHLAPFVDEKRRVVIIDENPKSIRGWEDKERLEKPIEKKRERRIKYCVGQINGVEVVEQEMWVSDSEGNMGCQMIITTGDDDDDTNKDSFVHALLFLLPLIFFTILKFHLIHFF